MVEVVMDEVDNPVEYPLDSTVQSTVQDRTFLNDNPDWLSARENVVSIQIFVAFKSQLTPAQDENPKEFASWDSLVTLTEQLLTKYPTPSQVVKDVITSTFDELLTRFPLFFGYWKKYTSLQYQMNGLDASIKVLSRALNSFPTSLDLWLDYLTILMSSSNDKDALRREFEVALSHVGNQFLSHSLWDKYIELEQSEKNIVGVMTILLRVIHIPLHQYSRYYQTFTTLKETIPQEQLIKLDSTLHIPEGVDQAALINEHYNRVFLHTQEFVGAVWPFESQIRQTYFNISPVSDQEFQNWNSFLQYLIQRHQQDSSTLNKQQTIATFERALIPTATSPHFWYKYLAWYLENYPTEMEKLDDIYKRAIDIYVPINYVDLRLNYAMFLEANGQDPEKIQEVYFSVMRLKRLKHHSMPVSEYVKFKIRSKNNWTESAKWLDAIITSFFKKDEDPDLEIRRFSELLNQRTIVIPIIELIKINWFYLKNHSNVKKYLSAFATTDSLEGCTSFWLLNYRYNRHTQDYRQLERVVNFVKDKSSLPISTINTILLDYVDALSNQTPESLTEENAYGQINALEYEVTHPLASRFEADEESLKRQKQQSGHAAVFIQKPHINNTIIDANVSKTESSALPMFKNVERASAKIVYSANE
jgi:pre-mRNA-processing factor 39